MKKLLLASLAVCSSAVADIDSRVIGGKTVTEGAWPATVALLGKAFTDGIVNGEYAYESGEVVPAHHANVHAHFCDGTLINANWVLTAAHCVYDSETGEVAPPESLYILTGVTNLLDEGVRIVPSRVIVHENYGPMLGNHSQDSDIALIEFDGFDPAVSLAPYLGEAAAGEYAVGVGWGRTDFDVPQSSPALQEADFEIADIESCRQSMGEAVGMDMSTPEGRQQAETLITDNMLCIHDPEYSESMCNGDSGGPLMAIQQDQYRQVGIVSFGINGCPTGEYYNVLTKVSAFDPWIRLHTGAAYY